MPGGPRAAPPITSLSPPKPTARSIPVSTPSASTLDKAAVEEGGAGDGWELEDGAEEELKVEDGRKGSDGGVQKSVLGRSGEEDGMVEASGTPSGPGRGVASVAEDSGIE